MAYDIRFKERVLRRAVPPALLAGPEPHRARLGVAQGETQESPEALWLVGRGD